MLSYPTNVESSFGFKLKAFLNELLALGSNYPFREGHRMRLQHDAFLEDAELTHCIAEWFLPVKHLEVYYTYAPHVNFRCNDGSLFLAKTFRRQIPIGSDSLRRKLDCVLLGGFAQSEVCDFDSSFVEENVLRFEVVVDDLIRELVQISNGAGDLSDDQLSLSFRNLFVLLQIITQIWSFAVL